MKRVGIVAIAVPALTVGTVALVSAYQADNDFQPFNTDRELQKNQVVFSDDEEAAGEQEQQQGEESEYWKKNTDSTKDKSPVSGSQNGKYLFENGLLDQSNQTNNITVLGDTATGGVQSPAGQGSGQPIYNLTGDKGNADTIIQGTVSQGGNGNGTGESGNGNGSSSGTDKNQGTDSNNGQNSSDSKTDDPLIPTPTPTPATRPASSAKDPDSNKATPGIIGGDSNPYTEDVSNNFKNPENTKGVIIQKSVINTDGMLYKGQIIDKTRTYNALETFAYIDDSKGNRSFYVWGSNALDNYIRIEAVSFDGGGTWSDVFPMTIPKDIDADQMVIRVGYRFSTNDTEWTQMDVPYAPEDSRIYVMTEVITEENQVLDTTKVLNSDQHLEEGTMLNLLRYQVMYLGEDGLTTLFPGWSEDGKLVDWYYIATVGRHILEPEEPVALDPAYTVQLRQVWMSDTFDVGWQYDNLCYLQALTSVEESALQTAGENETRLEVPEYIQAVMMDDDANISVDYLDIPDTVLYIAGNNDGLKVKKGYSVGENNPCYAMADDGVLTNKSGTEYLNIPYEKEEITVKEGVTKVSVSEKNEIRTLKIDASSMEEMPEISYENLKNCKILVKDDLLEEFMKENWDSLKDDPGNCVAAISEPTRMYRMKYGCMIDQNGSMRRLVDATGNKVQLASEVTNIEEGAFDGVENVATLLMPKNGENIGLEENCFQNSGIRKILCYTKLQYRVVQEQLKGSGASEDVEVELLATSKEGYFYAVTEEGGEKEVTLISVPDGLQSFDGVMTDQEGNPITITAVDDYAFSEAGDLEWVSLPESVKKIGYEAFGNCTALQGVIIESQDVIEIGNQAFDGCKALRFVASNAPQGVMDEDYDPGLTDTFGNRTFFTPTNSEGYYGNIWFTEESGVYSFEIVEVGETGKALYGTNAAGEPWLLLRSGGHLDAQVSLPDTTLEIWSQALEYTTTQSGRYTVNWEDLGQLWIDSGAFYSSQLGGDITLSDSCYLASYAVYNCDQLTSVTMGDNIGQIGEGTFGGCDSLITAQFGTMQDSVALYSGLFNDCNQLTSITINDYTAPSLVVLGTSGFQFNFGWTQEEEEANLKIRIPEGSEVNYVKKWRYFYAGYVESGDYPAYLNMWYDIRYQHIDWMNWEFPSDEEVDELVEAALLSAENRIRRMIGTETVSEPVDYYPYHLDNEGMLSLAGTPSDITVMNLWMQLDNLPDNRFLDYIGTGAFKRAKNLGMVLIPDMISGIFTNAFDGVESDSLMLYFMSETPPALKGWSEEHPFVFGTTSTPIYMMLPDGSEETYIQSWIFPMAGYEDLAAMRESIKTKLAEAGEDDSDQAVDIEVANRLLPLENQLRAMIGMEQITDPKDLSVTLDNLPDSEEAETDEELSGSEEETEETDGVQEDRKKEETEEDPDIEQKMEDSSKEEKQNPTGGSAEKDALTSEGTENKKENQENTDTAGNGSGEETQE